MDVFTTIPDAPTIANFIVSMFTYITNKGKVDNGLCKRVIMKLKVDPKQLALGVKAERHEHKWANVKTLEKIATDHILEKPYAYLHRKK